MSTASGDDYLVTQDAAPHVSIAEPRVSQWPFWLVSVVGLLGLGLIAVGRLPQGILGLVIAFGLAACLRLVLPAKNAGWLVSRSRGTDVAAFIALTGGLALTLFLIG